jgi:hypothetical protein
MEPHDFVRLYGLCNGAESIYKHNLSLLTNGTLSNEPNREM